MGWQSAVEQTVTGLGYELVECERGSQGLLRVTIDRLPAQAYDEPGDAVTVGDCERVTRQLQRVLEVEDFDYHRLEVSSPGVDRPLRTPAHWQRFVGHEVDVTLKMSFQGRKKYRGLLRAAEGEAEPAAEAGPRFELVFATEPGEAGGSDGDGGQQVLGFTLDEVREGRLVPVLIFKSKKAQDAGAGKRGRRKPAAAPATTHGVSNNES